MRRELHYMDITPKTVPAGEETKITVRPLGRHAELTCGREYTLNIIPMHEGPDYLTCFSFPEIKAVADESGLSFSWVFEGEQEHIIRIWVEDERFIALNIYSLLPDLYGRIPLKGDLHAHSTFSDGGECPETVAANYRKAGFDFAVISDHSEYAGSAAAKDYYKDVPLDMEIVSGEEVHAPDNHVHFVNFGGESSVNKIFQEDEKKYFEEVRELQSRLSITPEAGRVNPFLYASGLWITDKIRKCGGLSIFAHPFWTTDAYQVNLDFTKYLMKTSAFDAFELIGGLSPKENNLHIALYNEMKAAGGADFPVVGSSDSHGTVREPFEGSSFTNCVDNPYGFEDAFTIVFATENKTGPIIRSIKDGYAVAVDSYFGETPRVHGSFRLTSYALFLLSEYFPLHAELCAEQGRAMKEYASSKSPENKEYLTSLKGRIPKIQNKYFSVEFE